MAFTSNHSWHFVFEDVDDTVQTSAQESVVNGFIVARAPKGRRRAQYFPPNSGSKIDAVMGGACANWPDLIEAKAYNSEYPIYISAPPGASSAYPSYVGGYYLTKQGLYDFYKLEDTDDLTEGSGNAFITKVIPTLEKKFKSSMAASTVVVTLPSSLGLGAYNGDTVSIAEGGDNEYSISIKKPAALDVQFIDYDVMSAGLVSSSGTDTTYWDDDSSIWSFSGNTATLANFGKSYSTDEIAAFTKDSNPLVDWIGDEAFAAVKSASDLVTLLTDGAVNGASIAFPITGLFAYGVDISDITYCGIAQYSATEEKTTLKISGIGYDEYQYDRTINFALASGVDADTGVIDTDLDASNTDDDYVLFIDSKGKMLYIGANSTNENDEPAWILSDDLNTKIVVPQNPLDTTSKSKGSSIYHKFYRVEDSNEFTHLYTEEECLATNPTTGSDDYDEYLGSDEAVAKDVDFNTFTFSCSETVNGSTVSGGEWTGSLDEEGTNIYGNNIFWTNILGEDDVAFVKVFPNKKFGDISGDLDDNGFFTGDRILDPNDIDGDGSSPSAITLQMQGDRYATLVMEMNKNSGNKGGVWRSQWANIIKEGLEEACSPDYDDAYIFMEPTGQEQFKTYIKNINLAQDFAFTISPKLLSYDSNKKVTESIANKTVVNGRIGTGYCSAQFAGAFECADDVTGSHYIRYPIGAVGLQFARSIDKRYGAAGCFWFNDGNNLGGELDGTIIKAVYSIEDKADKILTQSKGINTIIVRNGGMMITSNVTVKNRSEISDWSSISSALSFLVFKREVRDNVMGTLIGKPINKFWVGWGEGQITTILSKRTAGNNPVWALGSIDMSESLNSVNRANKNFLARAKVAVNPNAETVTLVLNSVKS